MRGYNVGFIVGFFSFSFFFQIQNKEKEIWEGKTKTKRWG